MIIEERIPYNNLLKTTTITIDTWNEAIMAAQAGIVQLEHTGYNGLLREYDTNYGDLDADKVLELYNFYHLMRGKNGHIFRFCDPVDNYLNDQSLGNIDGTDVEVQIYKSYVFGEGIESSRLITKIDTSRAYTVSLNGSPLTEFVNYTLDSNTGIITVTGTGSLSITAYFDVPVYFSSAMVIEFASGLLRSLGGLKLMEVHPEVAVEGY